jgi:hypothetical protein
MNRERRVVPDEHGGNAQANEFKIEGQQSFPLKAVMRNRASTSL